MKAGDMVAAVTQAFGVKPCEACKERQRRLNEASDALARMFKPKGLRVDEDDRVIGLRVDEDRGEP